MNINHGTITNSMAKPVTEDLIFLKEVVFLSCIWMIMAVATVLTTVLIAPILLSPVRRMIYKSQTYTGSQEQTLKAI